MGRVFLISDNHFSDYEKMFSDLKRNTEEFGFKSTAEMNRIMISNWNRVVHPEDTVFHLGDFAWLKDEFVNYANQLNGRKIFILGNHDFEGNRWWLKEKSYENAVFSLMSILTYRNRDFLLVHNPADVPRWWKGWVIHGHVHYKIPKFPFIDGENKNINVSCDVIEFTPVDLDWIIDLDIDSIKKMDSPSSKPVRW